LGSPDHVLDISLRGFGYSLEDGRLALRAGKVDAVQ
jgi:hypothetical protein